MNIGWKHYDHYIYRYLIINIYIYLIILSLIKIRYSRFMDRLSEDSKKKMVSGIAVLGFIGAAVVMWKRFLNKEQKEEQ